MDDGLPIVGPEIDLSQVLYLINYYHPQKSDELISKCFLNKQLGKIKAHFILCKKTNALKCTKKHQYKRDLILLSFLVHKLRNGH